MIVSPEILTGTIRNGPQTNSTTGTVLSAVLNPVAATRGSDQTVPGDYHFEPAPAAETPTPVSAAA